MDITPLVAGMPLAHDTSLLRIWREGGFGVVSLDEDIDDDRSTAWRGAVDAHSATHGYMDFVVLDVHNVVATNSIAMRFKSAMWARDALQKLQQAAIYTGSNHKSGFVIATILRIAGLGNVTVLESEAALKDAIAGYRAGRPVPGVPVRGR